MSFLHLLRPTWIPREKHIPCTNKDDIERLVPYHQVKDPHEVYICTNYAQMLFACFVKLDQNKDNKINGIEVGPTQSKQSSRKRKTLAYIVTWARGI